MRDEGTSLLVTAALEYRVAFRALQQAVAAHARVPTPHVRAWLAEARARLDRGQDELVRAALALEGTDQPADRMP